MSSAPTVWTPERIEQLRDLAPHHSPSTIARTFGTTTASVYRMARKHRIRLRSHPLENQWRQNPMRRVVLPALLILLLSGCVATTRFEFASPLALPEPSMDFAPQASALGAPPEIVPLPVEEAAPDPAIGVILSRTGDGRVMATVYTNDAERIENPTTVRLIYHPGLMRIDQCTALSCTVDGGAVDLGGWLPMSATFFVDSLLEFADVRIESLDGYPLLRDGGATITLRE